MKFFIRRLCLMVLASLPIASVAFAAKKALVLGELNNKDDFESVSTPSAI